MGSNDIFSCPNCHERYFHIERKVTYVYTYKINYDNIKGTVDKSKSLPFLFDNREKSRSDEYVICENCGKTFPVELEENNDLIAFTILQKAIRSDHTNNPEFLG